MRVDPRPLYNAVEGGGTGLLAVAGFVVPLWQYTRIHLRPFVLTQPVPSQKRGITYQPIGSLRTAYFCRRVFDRWIFLGGSCPNEPSCFGVPAMPLEPWGP